MKFQVGDRVEVIDEGCNYKNYIEWVTKYAPNYKFRYKPLSISNGTQGIIKVMNMHIDHDRELYLLESDGGQVILINGVGLKLIKGDKKMKLKLELFRYENVVFGKVLEQSEDLRGMETIQHNGFKISSISNPELSYDTLFIRGDTLTSDNHTFSANYSSIKKAKEVVENIKILVDKVNEVENEVTPNGKIIQIL